MSQGSRSRSERRLGLWLLATGGIYAAGAVDFLVRPWAATRSLNSYVPTPDIDRMEDEEPGFYNALASAYMATIAALAIEAGRSPSEKSNLIPALLVAKAVSSSAFLYRFVSTRKRGYAAAALLDAVLFGVTAGLYSDLD
ncbi:MAG: hypothetical protein QOG04_2104 [Actinomycetota bacterium]|jgi:hypothetical protein|nr:hypothetical protein [Actinomycetota bacterium]